ncbi:helix-turn-helix domain-containing protein [Streptomyces sp. NPDC002324]
MTRNDLTELDAKAQAVILLARGMNSDKVGETVGVSGRTVRRWAEQSDFKTDVETARRALLDEAVRALSSAARDAVDVLHASLTDDNASIRLRAAVALLGALPSISEHVALEERIAALEAAIDPERTAA